MTLYAIFFCWRAAENQPKLSRNLTFARRGAEPVSPKDVADFN